QIAQVLGAPVSRRRARSLSFRTEQKLFKQHLAQGLTYPQAERKVMRRLRRAEPPIDASLRVQLDRISAADTELRRALTSPRRVDPVSDALTALLRLGVFERARVSDIPRYVRILHQVLGVAPLL